MLLQARYGVVQTRQGLVDAVPYEGPAHDRGSGYVSRHNDRTSLPYRKEVRHSSQPPDQRQDIFQERGT